MDFKSLIGKKVVAYRGIPETKYGKTKTELSFMLFDDGETYIEFGKQDPYDYHDCSASARGLTIWKNKKMWEGMMSGDTFKEPDNLGAHPFN